MPKGVPWRPVQASGLSEKSRNLYHQYREAYEAAKAIGAKLKTAVQQDWDMNYPNGLDRKFCSFNVVNGILNYAWVPTKKSKRQKRGLDETEGDNVFASPLASGNMQQLHGADQPERPVVTDDEILAALKANGLSTSMRGKNLRKLARTRLTRLARSHPDLVNRLEGEGWPDSGEPTQLDHEIADAVAKVGITKDDTGDLLEEGDAFSVDSTKMDRLLRKLPSKLRKRLEEFDITRRWELLYDSTHHDG
jgi:hypothetical protein